MKITAPLTACLASFACAIAAHAAPTLVAGPYINPLNVTNNVTYDFVNTNNPLYIESGVVTNTPGGFGYSDNVAPEYYFQGQGVVDSITLQGGGQFGDVQFGLGTGFYAGSYAYYDLLLGGNSVLSGSFGYIPGYGTGPGESFNPQTFGFSGGGFDTILISDDPSNSEGYVGDGSYSAIEFSNFENAGSSVPDNANTLSLLGLGLIALLAAAKRQAKRA